LQETFDGDCSIRRWAIDDTNYLDWYFALSRLAKDGSKPEFVVLGAEARHLVAGHVRGHFFSHYILGWSDLVDAAMATGKDHNGSVNMALARVSAFYGSREEIFKGWLTALLPSFPTLGRAMAANTRRRTMNEAERFSLMCLRLKELKQACSANGAKLIIWIPPLLQFDPLSG
jgi:hypothetical protein